jgi:hypothetical protein
MFQDIGLISVKAPHFDDPSKTVLLAVSQSWVATNAAHARIQPLFDFWALVEGVPPPVNNIGFHEKNAPSVALHGLLGTDVVFRGLCRPLDGDDHEGEVYAFVTRPGHIYTYEAHMVCVAKARPFPHGAVFACYVRRFQQETAEGFSGIVLSWELVRADDADANLPQDWQGRYRHEVWRR